MHQKNVVHRDLKINNVLVHSKEGSNEFDIRVIDFGIAKQLKVGEILT